MTQHVGIFGSSGYLGSRVILICSELSISYAILDRKLSNNDPLLLSSISKVIDCGFPPDYYKKSIATKYMIEIKQRAEQFQSLGRGYLYVSTFSGITTRKTGYSKLKNRAGDILSAIEATCLRVGLVTSESNPGGRYLELRRLAQSLPFLIIPSKNWFPVLIYKLEDFELTIRNFLINEDVIPPTEYQLKSLSELISEMKLPQKKFELPGWCSALLAMLIRLLPLKKMEGLKAISVSESFAISGLAEYAETKLRNDEI